MQRAAPESAASEFGTLRALMSDAEAQWSAGAFGAIAEFSRDADEPAEVRIEPQRLSASTARGAVAIGAHPGMRLVAYETVSRDIASWRHSIALCLPDEDCAMGRRTVVTELGPDHDAVRAADRESVLFDLGLDLLQTDACIRTSDQDLIEAMRGSAGRPLFEPRNGALAAILHASPHRVFATRLGRVEVFQPIPQAHGKSPPGPHTHILPKLLRARRTHAATTPIPDGWVPCANVYPAHAVLDTEGLPRAFDRQRFADFDDLLARFGDPQLVSLQMQVAEAVAAQARPADLALPDSRFARASLRVGLRKLRASGVDTPALRAWLAHFDRISDEDGEDEAQHAC